MQKFSGGKGALSYLEADLAWMHRTDVSWEPCKWQPWEGDRCRAVQQHPEDD